MNGISSRKKSGFVREYQYQLLLSKHSLSSLFFSVLGGVFVFTPSLFLFFLAGTIVLEEHFLETQYRDTYAHKHTYILISVNTRTQPSVTGGVFVFTPSLLLSFLARTISLEELFFRNTVQRHRR